MIQINLNYGHQAFGYIYCRSPQTKAIKSIEREEKVEVLIYFDMVFMIIPIMFLGIGNKYGNWREGKNRCCYFDRYLKRAQFELILGIEIYQYQNAYGEHGANSSRVELGCAVPSRKFDKVQSRIKEKNFFVSCYWKKRS